MVGGERPLLPEILGQKAPVGAKSPIAKAIYDSYNVWINTI